MFKWFLLSKRIIFNSWCNNKMEYHFIPQYFDSFHETSDIVSSDSIFQNDFHSTISIQVSLSLWKLKHVGMYQFEMTIIQYLRKRDKENIWTWSNKSIWIESFLASLLVEVSRLYVRININSIHGMKYHSGGSRYL